MCPCVCGRLHVTCQVRPVHFTDGSNGSNGSNGSKPGHVSLRVWSIACHMSLVNNCMSCQLSLPRIA
jgi:hypothetical protein